MQKSFYAQRKEARQLGVKATEYAVLQSELRRSERICDILDGRIKELNVTEDIGAMNISILEVARAASSPSSPQKTRVMSMALALGFAVGFCLAFIRDWMDYRLRSSEEVASVLGVPVLGIVPTIPQHSNIGSHSQKVWHGLKLTVSKVYAKIRAGVCDTQKTKTQNQDPVPRTRTDSSTSRRRQRILTRAEAYRQLRTNGTLATKSRSSYSPSSGTDSPRAESKGIVDREQIVRLKPKSIVAEAYRTIRTAIFFGVPKGESRTILVTSPSPGDGKTTLVSNLAIAMAQAGQKILVMDADFRKPKQHKLFELDNEVGIVNILSGSTRLDDAIHSGPIIGLDLLTRGPEVPNPSELLNSDSFAELLKILLKCYDRIIIDSPPVTAVADRQIIAAICDVVLLVLMAGKSTRKQSQHARDSLISVGGRLIGAVVNDVSSKSGTYGYKYYGGYGHYGNYSYYGDKEKEKEYEQSVVV